MSLVIMIWLSLVHNIYLQLTKVTLGILVSSLFSRFLLETKNTHFRDSTLLNFLNMWNNDETKDKLSYISLLIQLLLVCKRSKLVVLYNDFQIIITPGYFPRSLYCYSSIYLIIGGVQRNHIIGGSISKVQERRRRKLSPCILEITDNITTKTVFMIVV